MDRMSGLPTIKCSSCGIDIDILQLADHVCATAPLPSPAAASSGPAIPAPAEPQTLLYESASPKLERAATFGGGGPSFSARYDSQTSSSRMPAPPMIDSQAANKPFRPLEPSPMSSNYSEPRTRSPLPSAPPKSPYMLNRSATSPMPQSVSPPSPDLPPNMDSAFPRFPTNRIASPRSARPQDRGRLDATYGQQYPEPSPLFAPLSPHVNGGENVSKRMDSIAPGPFDGRRPSTASAPRSPSQEPSHRHVRTETQGSFRSSGSAANSRTSLASSTSRASAYSTRSISQSSRSKMALNGATAPPPLPVAVKESEGIDAFLGRLQAEAQRPGRLSQDDRSKTYPLRQESQERRGPPPRPRRPSEKDLPPANIAEYKTSDFAPRSNNLFPSRNPSRTESETGIRSQGPSRTLQPPSSDTNTYNNNTPSAALHTPSDSGLSDDSYASYTTRSVASSRSSPPGSEAGHSRNVSKVSRSDYLTEGGLSRTASPDSFIESNPPSSQNQGRRPPISYTRSNPPEPIPQILSPGFPSPSAPESPMDPAIQFGGFFERPSKEQLSSQDPALNIGRSPPRRRSGSNSRQAETRRPAPASKGNCRGCAEPIVGKSVKDSSGRLTGRYHRSCFVCRTCGDGFPTAEFYVYKNAPYCEHHYHELNDSLCRLCNRGIEGQYLETDTREKFHPRCFTCATCRIPLSADYYEVGGRKFCERHGRQAAAPRQNYLGPGDYRPRNMQKRRTRLMMM